MQGIPPLLRPHLEANVNLTLVTYTLSNTPSWLLLRYIVQTPAAEKAVVLVSWLHDAKFWHDGLKRMVGAVLDPADLFAVVLLLFSETQDTPPVNVCNPPLTAAGLAQIPSTDPPLLILDGLDFLIAASDVSPTHILDFVQRFSHVIITAAADAPLIHCPPCPTPLEQDHAGWVMSLAHRAGQVLSLRSLDTGGAKDISGVLSVVDRRGDCNESHEYLYLVGADGGAKVFVRGASESR